MRPRAALLVALAVLLPAVAVVTIVGRFGADPAPAGPLHIPALAVRLPPLPPPELPRGGFTILPRYRVVAYYGGPPTPALGVLGAGTPDEAAAKLAAQARAYAAGGRPVMPALELIATVASGAPEKGGRYSYRQSAATIDRYLAAARRAKALLVLDVQPGRSPFMDEVRAYRRWLEQPDVSLALDPEWDMPPGAIPGKVIGSVDASVVNRVSAYLAAIVHEYRLPQKLLIVHEFTDTMVTRRDALAHRRGLALTINVDGVGPSAAKIGRYEAFTHEGSAHFMNGFKVFYRQDPDTMSPPQVLALEPRPDLIVYQ